MSMILWSGIKTFHWNILDNASERLYHLNTMDFDMGGDWFQWCYCLNGLIKLFHSNGNMELITQRVHELEIQISWKYYLL